MAGIRASEKISTSPDAASGGTHFLSGVWFGERRELHFSFKSKKSLVSPVKVCERASGKKDRQWLICFTIKNNH